MTGRAVAVVGATGAVGREMVATLQRRAFPVGSLRLLASARSAGKRLATPWGEVEVEDLATADPAGIEIALFSAGAARAREHAPRFAAAGAVVVDNSSAWRMDSHVPLVVAGVNDDAARAHRGIIANPNCTTMVLLMAVAPLHRAAGLEAMVVSSYQSVSGIGQKGMDIAVGRGGALPPAAGRTAVRRLVGPGRGDVRPADRVQRAPPGRFRSVSRATPTRSGSWCTRPARSSPPRW